MWVHRYHVIWCDTSAHTSGGSFAASGEQVATPVTTLPGTNGRFRHLDLPFAPLSTHSQFVKELGREEERVARQAIEETRCRVLRTYFVRTSYTHDLSNNGLNTDSSEIKSRTVHSPVMIFFITER